MKCSHPVQYRIGGRLICQICGETIEPQEPPHEEPTEQAEKPKKKKKKTDE